MKSASPMLSVSHLVLFVLLPAGLAFANRPSTKPWRKVIAPFSGGAVAGAGGSKGAALAAGDHSQDGGQACTALLLIEAQERYRVAYGPGVVGRLADLDRGFRGRGLPVFRRLWQCECNGLTSAANRWEGCGVKDCSAPDALHNFDNQLLEEMDATTEQEANRTWFGSSYSLFANVPLHERLQALGVKTLVMGGGYTEMCVAASAIHAHTLGYNVIIASDAVGPVGQGYTALPRTLELLQRYGLAKVGQASASILESLNSRPCSDLPNEMPVIDRFIPSPFMAPFPYMTPHERVTLTGPPTGFVAPKNGIWATSMTVTGALSQRNPALVRLGGVGPDSANEPAPRIRLDLPAGAGCGAAFLERLGELRMEQVDTLVLVARPDDQCMLILPYLAHSYDFDVVVVSEDPKAAVPFHVDHAIAVAATWKDVREFFVGQALNSNRMAGFTAIALAGLKVGGQWLQALVTVGIDVFMVAKGM